MVDQEPHERPVDLFDKRTKDVTNIREYLTLLVQHGLPALHDEYFRPERDPETIDEDYITAIGFSFARVLRNRDRQGIPNDKAVDFNIIAFGQDRQFEEYIVDEDTKRRVMKGLILGLVLAGLIPPELIVGDNPIES